MYKPETDVKKIQISISSFKKFHYKMLDLIYLLIKFACEISTIKWKFNS